MSNKSEKEGRNTKKTLGIALSGGGSRAIAFHLGCFRALHDLGYLDKIKFMSSVSGGSVISALYCFYEESFEDFDKRVMKVLKSGLQLKIFLNYIWPLSLVKAIITQLIAGSAAFICSILNLLPSVRIAPPFLRWYSRTHAFIKVLEKELYQGLTLNSSVKNDINVIINACELSTGTAFRFGNNETGNWRKGKVKENSIPVAEAVGCSAAYPVLLPALNKRYEFEQKKLNEPTKLEVFLTDGGVFDNTGVTCFDPEKDSEKSFNSFKPDYVFAFDADHRINGPSSHPYFMISRLSESFKTTFKKRTHGIMNDLHSYKEAGKIEGFIYSYLGQNDSKLHEKPKDFVTVDKVNTYPTDFKAMKEEDIKLLTKRGEQITRLLISQYKPVI